MDEATNGLDPVVRDEVTDLLLDFARDENHSILISSHIVSDLEKLCDTIAFLHKGRLLLCEEKDALREEYALWHGTAAQLAALDTPVYGKRVTPYGAEALVRRDAMPAGAELAPVSIEELFHAVWKDEYYSKNSSTITVHIRHLREKLKDTSDTPQYIKTIWGVGYKI